MRHLFFLLALLAVAAGCAETSPSTSRDGMNVDGMAFTEIVVFEGHEYLYFGERAGAVHSASCPNHSLLVEITERRSHILSAAPAGTVLVPFPGEDVRLETDTMNRLGKPVNYLCIQANVPGEGLSYLRLEADQDWKPTKIGSRPKSCTSTRARPRPTLAASCLTDAAITPAATAEAM